MLCQRIVIALGALAPCAALAQPNGHRTNTDVLPTASRSADEIFIGAALLGRPTDHSVTVNAVPAVAAEVYIEYGDTPGDYDNWLTTPILACEPYQPAEAVLPGLSADTRYHYRLRYRRSGEADFLAGPKRTFHTQRGRGSTFTFTIQTDSHLLLDIARGNTQGLELYERTLLNALADGPDFHFDLGDTFNCEFYWGGDVTSYAEAVERHLDQRPYFGLLCHSSPLFLALGNHEGEQGWRLDGTPDNVAVWATNARQLLYLNPFPDSFYTGSAAIEPFVGQRENFYAWEWGSALFVVLDPYWYTTSKPHHDGGPGSGDNWDWTLGDAQYNWLAQTLAGSEAPFKFVFSHHVTGGVDLYGRGGAEAAPFYEWGGRNEDGSWGFADRRPGWAAPIHQLLINNQVSAFFHGHDHVFVKQDLDEIVYQECPCPNDADYGSGYYEWGQYVSGDMVANSGHVRVTVHDAYAVVEYVRAYRPEDEDQDHLNGDVDYSYTIYAPCDGADFDHDGDVDLGDLATFAVCFTGPGTPVTAECACCDLDGDGDVDLSDFSAFSVYFARLP